VLKNLLAVNTAGRDGGEENLRRALGPGIEMIRRAQVLFICELGRLVSCGHGYDKPMKKDKAVSFFQRGVKHGRYIHRVTQRKIMYSRYTGGVVSVVGISVAFFQGKPLSPEVPWEWN
jgi:hypothetical protein